MNPFVLTGPQFLRLYAVLLVISVVVAWVARQRALGTAAAAAMPADLDIYERAVLSTGTTQRAVDVALKQLADGGLRIDGKGLVDPDPRPVAAHPVERAVLTCIDEVPTHITAVRGRAARHAALEGLRDRLVDAGLLISPQMRARARGATLAFVPLLVLGMARLGRGSQLGRPVGYLVILLMVTVALALWLWGRMPTRTRRGEELHYAEQTRNTALRTAAEHGRVGSSPDAALALALFGIGALSVASEPALSGARRSGVHRPTAASCGGCGGAGCGGGRCGGCGGCGG
ncbi:MAG: TIGR04222 domain-containing membrane protein [Egibacteraceae bacterium]